MKPPEKSSPSAARAMTSLWNFVVALVRTAKSLWELKSSVESGYGDKTMSYSQINCFIKVVQDQKLTKMMKRTPDIDVAVATAI